MVMLSAIKYLIKMILRNLKKYADKTDQRDPYRHFIDHILTEVPQDVYSEIRSGSGKAELFYEDIVSLRTKIKTRMHEVNINQDEYDRLVKEAFDMESILRAKVDEQRQLSGDFFSSHFIGIRWMRKNGENGGFKRKLQELWIVRAAQWIWYVYLRHPVFLAATVLLAICSVLIVWCECFFFFRRK